jgi:flagellar protein FlaF
MSNMNQHNAYKTHQHVEEQPDSRDADARALLSCAAGLRTALDAGLKNDAYGEAIRKNQHLWTIFQVSLTDPDNGLPKALKMTLLSLSRYVDRISFRAVQNFAPPLLTSLIDINRTIAAGLMKRPETTAQSGISTPVYAGGAVVNPVIPPSHAGPITTSA